MAPATIFLGEILIRIKGSFGSHGYTYIQQGTILPSRVIHLVIKRPPSFDFRPGDWVFVQIPEIATAEWHPFTISSAPEMSDVVWLHIRAVGEWTNRLLKYFIEQETRVRERNRLLCLQGFDYDRSIVNNSCEISSIRQQHTPINDITLTPITPGNRQQRLFDTVAIDLKTPNNFANLSRSMINNLKKIQADRQESTPLPQTKPATDFHVKRFASFHERRMGGRGKSKIYLLPRPDDCDEFACKRKSVFHGSVEAGYELDNLSKRAKADGDISSILSLRRKELELSRNQTSSKGTLIKLDRPLHLHIDGPYGSPTSHIFSTQHAVLIATGIGVTPFASILQSIMYRYIKAKHVCPQCDHSWSDPDPPLMMQLKKVDFVWINRDQKSFEWFVNLLTELEITQAQLNEAERFLDMHMYITSALDKSDMKAIGLQLALDLMHEKGKRDLITGLKTRTQPGRPDWDKVSVTSYKVNECIADEFFPYKVLP